jgi:hypothetical protein
MAEIAKAKGKDGPVIETVLEASPEGSVVTFNDDGTKVKATISRGRGRTGFAMRRISSIDSSLKEGKSGRSLVAQLAGAGGSSAAPSTSTCAEPNHEELLMSVGAVLQRRIEGNEMLANKREVPLFLEDTHTRVVRPDTYEVAHPLLLARTMSMPTIFGVRRLPKPAPSPQTFHVPSVHTIVHFLQNIWRKARLTPHCVIICLVYVDRLEAKSEDGVLLHARSWRPIIFSALLLASKVWHDISYWNSDFSTICPMFTLRNVNMLERTILELLQYDTIISSSQYAQYYFSLRQASLRQQQTRTLSEADSIPSKPDDNFRTKLMMRVGVPASNKLRTRSQTAHIAPQHAAEQAGANALLAPRAPKPELGESEDEREEQWPLLARSLPPEDSPSQLAEQPAQETATHAA